MTAPAEAAEVASEHPRRVRRNTLLLAGGVAVVLATFAVVLATRPSASTRAVESPLIGRPAPLIVAPTVDGGRVNISDFRGRWVLVNYFATWCVPCRREHPDLVRFAERHKALGEAEVIGVVFADNFEAVRSFRRDNGGDWPMAEDPDGKIALAWGVTGVPESFLVDPAGIVRAKVLGGVTDARLEDLLAGLRSGSASPRGA